MGTLLAPPGITLRGVNIGVDPTPGFGDFYVLWRDWANDATPRSWNNYIKPQIAYAAGQAGCNCIGLNTSMWAVIYGSISLATAQAQLVQFVSYCKSLGLWVHLRQGDGHRPYDNTFTSITPTAASIYGFINSMHSVVAAYDNIIGWDIAPEWEATGAALHGSPYVWVSGSAGGGEVACGALQQAIYAGVKIPYSNLPLTSAVTSAPGATGKNSARDFVAAFSLDYISFDAYRMNNWPANVVPGAGGDHRAIVWSDISYFRTTYPNHDILFSEAGVNTTGSETTSGPGAGNHTLTLVGSGTTWSGGTTFSVTSPLVFVSKSVADATHATVVVTAGSIPSNATISDGTTTEPVTVGTPSFSAAPSLRSMSAAPAMSLP
jgi:hypothetical protein